MQTQPCCSALVCSSGKPWNHLPTHVHPLTPATIAIFKGLYYPLMHPPAHLTPRKMPRAEEEELVRALRAGLDCGGRRAVEALLRQLDDGQGSPPGPGREALHVVPPL